MARLIAGGRSNKEIAAAPVISQRTAEGHVEYILAKPGITSRAQIAAWVAASQPDGEGRLAAPGAQAPVVSAVPQDWPAWYAAYLVAEQAGTDLPA